MARSIPIRWVALVAIIAALCVMPNLALPAKDTNGHGQAGIGVDSKGGAVIDPTTNVLGLVESAVKRLDDMRGSNEKYLEAETRHIREQAILRADYDKLLRENERARQEKVREVDVLGARTEADRAQAAIKALAESSAMTAETLRKTVETTALSQASQLDMKFAESNKRLAAVEQLLSEGRGKQTMSDPQLAELVTEMRTLRSLQAQGTGKDEGTSQVIGWIVALIGTLFGAGGVGLYIGKKKQEPA